MAAVARPQSAGGSIKIALIVFVVLTVASLTGTIIILTNYSNMQAREADARNAAAQSDRRMQETQQQLERFAALVIGKSTSEIPEIKQAMDEVRGQVAADPALKDANLTPDTALVTMLRTLYTRFTAQGEQYAKDKARLDELDKEREQIVKTAEATRKEFTDKTDELTAKYEQLEQTSAKDREAWQQQVATLTDQLEKASEAAGAQLTAERQQRQTIAKQLEECQGRAGELVATLASFRPQPDMASAMQIADGQIIRAVAGENIVYISLGERDGLKRGITFAVYSRLGGIPADGKGKATVLVEQVFETTAECRVTSGTNGDPIIEGDLVANPVFDKSRKLNFVVAGEFDLNFDGKIDDPDGAQVADLIAQAGGSVVRKIDTRTDFVVLGAPPPLPVEGAEAASPEAQERAAKRAAVRQAFDAVAQEAKALSIPVLTRTQFLHFIGIKVPVNAPEDTIPG
jgi:vacuolar-type H+-ATPase subunit E/Vma4